MGSAGFGVDRSGLEGRQAWHPEMALGSTVCDKGHIHWSLSAQDVLVLPFNYSVTLARCLTFSTAQFVHL